MPGGTVNHRAHYLMIEALGASRLKVIFFVVTMYAGYPQDGWQP